LSQKYVKNSERMVWREIDEETVVMDMENGYIHSLDDIATIIWSLFDEYRDINRVCEKMQEEFPDVEKEEIRNDLVSLVEDLVEKDMLIPEKELGE